MNKTLDTVRERERERERERYSRGYLKCNKINKDNINTHKNCILV